MSIDFGLHPDISRSVNKCGSCNGNATISRIPVDSGPTRTFYHSIHCANADCPGKPYVRHEELRAALRCWNGQPAERGGEVYECYPALGPFGFAPRKESE